MIVHVFSQVVEYELRYMSKICDLYEIGGDWENSTFDIVALWVVNCVIIPVFSVPVLLDPASSIILSNHRRGDSEDRTFWFSSPIDRENAEKESSTELFVGDDYGRRFRKAAFSQKKLSLDRKCYNQGIDMKTMQCGRLQHHASQWYWTREVKGLLWQYCSFFVNCT